MFTTTLKQDNQQHPGIRYEIKIPYPERQLPEVLAWVRLHPAHWRIAYPSRQVNNIYFDTYIATNLNENIDGVSHRTKSRIRWYGSNIELVKDAQFEIKQKRGWVGWKKVYPLPCVLKLTNGSWSDIIQELRVSSNTALNLMNTYPIPTIINTYYRRYYVSLDSTLRLTIDTKLYSYSQMVSSVPNIKSQNLTEPVTIVEIKTHPENLEQMVKVLSDTNARISRFSKYVNAMMASPNI